MFGVGNPVLFDIEVIDGKIGLMEKDFFYSEDNYYSKKDGSLISVDTLLMYDQKRFTELKFEIEKTSDSDEKVLLQKEQDALKEIAIIHKHFPETSYVQLRRRVYFVLNSARTYDNFVYCRALYSKNDFKIQFVKDDEQRIGMVLLQKDAIIYGRKKSMTEKYKARYEFVDCEKLSREKEFTLER